MQRRKFAVAMGALATGSGAVLTSGAFSQVESQRDVLVESVIDDQALLEFAPVDGRLLSESQVAGTIESRSGFVDLVENNADNAAVELDFSDMESSDLPGNGLNNRSVTVIEDVFHILNAGATDIELSIHDAGNDLSGNADIAGEDSLVELGDQPEGISFFVSRASDGSEATSVDDLGVEQVSMNDAADLTDWTSGTTSSLADYIDASSTDGYDDIGAVTLGVAIDVGDVTDDINGGFSQSGENSETVTIVAQTTDSSSNIA